ncbi:MULTISPECIES: E3 binding domain-containing protein [unclassified Meiothermus]|uniref:E3 binding domain-containing protein n=1 Tax=unclassified Meiothermus TaxID=370471 RepID=UPI000D7C7756|nr:MULTISPECIES: E3 binding domain-containing protein [unclassified Meiothermus]PZA07633.1 hypothetical protein DNA98_08260 [Meiothermus sp. Pnk-1]RYM36814.1 hypothetical protein EWH23_08510 [Meiothermus sp. PNK-Is4]
MSEPKITPLARRLAEENGIDWRTLKGSGPEGTIVERDILSFLAKVMAGEIDLPPTPEEQPAPPETIPDISQAQAMLAKEGVSLSDVIPTSQPTPPKATASTFSPPPPGEPPRSGFSVPPLGEKPADKHPTLGDFDIVFDDLGLEAPGLEAEAPASGPNSEPMPAITAEPAPPSLDVTQFPGLSREEQFTWPGVSAPSSDPTGALPHSKPAPLDLGDWGEPEVSASTPAEPPLPSWPEAIPSSWGEPAAQPWQEPSPEPSVPPWQGETVPPAWQAEPAPAEATSFGEESPISELPAEPAPSFAETPEEPAAPEAAEMAPAAWSGFAASGADTTPTPSPQTYFPGDSQVAPTPAAPLRVQAWQQLVQVGAAAQAAETLAQAWHREVGMLPLLYRAAEKALADLELPLRANKGVLEGETLRAYQAVPAHTLRGTLEALEAATEAEGGLVVLVLDSFDQLIFPGAKVLSLGRRLGEQALLSVSGDLEAKTASRLLERVAYYLERPILLA